MTTIRITEVFPNPAGSDTKDEFIELTNFSSAPINLKDYQLDDILSDGSKAYKIPEIIIQPNQSIVFKKTETHLNLNNDKDEVHLLSQTGTKEIDAVVYSEVQENKSFSLIEVKSKTGERFTYQWTDSTPQNPNPPLYDFSGTIAAEPQIKNTFEFDFKPENSAKTIKVLFNEEILDFNTSAILLKKNTEAKLLLKKIDNQTFELVNYKIENKTETQIQAESSSLPLKALQPPTLLTTLGLGLIVLFSLALAFHFLLKTHRKTLE